MCLYIGLIVCISKIAMQFQRAYLVCSNQNKRFEKTMQ